MPRGRYFSAQRRNKSQRGNLVLILYGYIDFLSRLSGGSLFRLAAELWDYITFSASDLLLPVFGQFNFMPSKQPSGSQEGLWRNGIEVGCYFDDAGNVLNEHRDFVLETIVDSSLHKHMAIFGSHFQ